MPAPEQDPTPRRLLHHQVEMFGPVPYSLIKRIETDFHTTLLDRNEVGRERLPAVFEFEPWDMETGHLLKWMLWPEASDIWSSGVHLAHIQRIETEGKGFGTACLKMHDPHVGRTKVWTLGPGARGTEPEPLPEAMLDDPFHIDPDHPGLAMLGRWRELGGGLVRSISDTVGWIGQDPRRSELCSWNAGTTSSLIQRKDCAA